eukprot:SM000009S23599  [mRNA]  locus=s9:986605:990059:+ [translate_table: standard]
MAALAAAPPAAASAATAASLRSAAPVRRSALGSYAGRAATGPLSGLRLSAAAADRRPAALVVRSAQTADAPVETVKSDEALPPAGHNKLHELYEQGGQSPWIDNLSRGWIQSGQLEELVKRGVRGLTSNPTIFQKAIEATDLYDEQFRSLLKDGKDVEEAYWQLVIKDIKDALKIMRPLFDDSKGEDGWVSIEVAPKLANDTEATFAAARWLDEQISEPNLYIKVPGTMQGVLDISKLIAEGHSVNVTLIFGLGRYNDVIDAYISGLEEAADHNQDLSHISSVASFFLSRVDSEVDKRLDKIGSEEAKSLRGKAAIAQAMLAYKLFQDKFSGDRWERLKAKNARVQRPLWASTSTKDPSYPDTMYVDNLIGPTTVNTMPTSALLAFADHGKVERTVDRDLKSAEETIEKLKGLGIDLEEVAEKLEVEGVEKFVESFDELIGSLKAKAESWNTGKNN